MKRVVLLVTLMLFVLGVRSEAQTASGRALPNTFPTLAKCVEAMDSGLFRFYEPKYFGLNPKDPANSRDRIVVPLEGDTCLEMLVVGGRQFVVQKEGTLFRARKQLDGSLSLYARDDCGNPVYGVVYQSPAPVETVSEQGRDHYARRPLLQPEPPPPIEYRTRYVRDDRPPPQKKGGFCGSKTCRWTVGLVAVSAGGYAAWRFWPCPPGTVRR